MNLRKYREMFFLVMISFLFFETLNAATGDPITISNPNFRKLVIASPEFTSAAKDEKITAYLKQTKEEFPFILQFTGFFKIIDAKAYADKKEMAKVDEFPFWKMLGVDTVVQGRFIKDEKAIKLELSGLDVYRSQDLDKRIYTIRTSAELNRAMKRYVDYLLETYTGKPGIFQSKIVFAGKETKNSVRSIFICDPDGTNVQKISKAKAIHISPSWHPSGDKIVYTSYEQGTPNLYLYQFATKSYSLFPGFSTVRGIMNSGGKFAPQGKLLVYTQISEGDLQKKSSADLYLSTFGAAKQSRRPFVKGDGIDVDPIFSPDGKWLVYVSGRYGNPHLFKSELIWNDDFTDVKIKSEQRLTFAGWWNAMPSWSPDSQKIAFAGFDKDINRFDLFIMNNDGSKMERLTLQMGDNQSPTFSPNGHLIMFHSSRIGTASGRGRNQLYIMNQDGTEQRVLSTGLYDAEDPKWGPYIKDE